LPSGFQEILSAVTRNASATPIRSKYEIDNVVVYSGNSSLKLSADNTTTDWYAIGKQILTNYDSIYISYAVKANNIHQEGNQFQDCHVGFVFTDKNGNHTLKINFYSGTFDWSQGELRLSSAELKYIRDNGSRVDLVVLLAMSGEFWVDKLKFEFTALNPPISNVTTETYDFENQTTSLPSGFLASLGAVTRNASTTPIGSRYEIDNTVFYSGDSSLKLSGDNTTTDWFWIGKQLLTNYNSIYLTYTVKGNNIIREGTQYQDCYVGFMFTDSNGNKTYKINSYSGTFDWSQGELRLSAAELQSIRDSGSRVDLVIFLDMTGQLWVDDLEIEYTPLSP
jgi:hypothetical protein